MLWRLIGRGSASRAKHLVEQWWIGRWRAGKQNTPASQTDRCGVVCRRTAGRPPRPRYATIGKSKRFL